MDQITIVRSFNRKSFSIQIISDTVIKVSAPFYYTDSKIKKILNEKKDWIEQKQLEIRLRKQKKGSFIEEVIYLGKKYELVCRYNQKNIIEIKDKMYIASDNKKLYKNYLTGWYKQQARKIISERVNYYSQIYGLRFKSINITSAETRWGSCSSEKSLNFNWKLIMAPLDVLDYVVAHELAHLEELNHSKDFWEKVRKISPLYRQYRTWLRRNGHTLTI